MGAVQPRLSDPGGRGETGVDRPQSEVELQAGEEEKAMDSEELPVNPQPIGRYFNPGAVCNPYDPHAPEAARELIRLILAQDSSLSVEHVGSTAVPECDGKGILDLLVMDEAGGLERAKAALADLGFQKQTGRDPFPEERPMRRGCWEYKGRPYPVHAHVISCDSPEAAELIWFRDALRADPALRAAYVERKREIIRKGVADSLAYSIIKGSFVQRVLGVKKENG
jgi:GrpB-like predicted nucleotidyltransferase (UPF0157 family)